MMITNNKQITLTEDESRVLVGLLQLEIKKNLAFRNDVLDSPFDDADRVAYDINVINDYLYKLMEKIEF